MFFGEKKPCIKKRVCKTASDRHARHKNDRSASFHLSDRYQGVFCVLDALQGVIGDGESTAQYLPPPTSQQTSSSLTHLQAIPSLLPPPNLLETVLLPLWLVVSAPSPIGLALGGSEFFTSFLPFVAAYCSSTIYIYMHILLLLTLIPQPGDKISYSQIR